MTLSLMPIPLRESSSVVLTSERNQLIYKIQFKYIGNFSINNKSYDVLWTCITTEVKVWNNSALKRVKWMKCSRKKMISNEYNIFLVDWGFDKNKNRKPQAIQCRYQSFSGGFHAVHVMWFMSCDLCHVIHVMGFMSCFCLIRGFWGGDDPESDVPQSAGGLMGRRQHQPGAWGQEKGTSLLQNQLQGNVCYLM